MRTLREVDLGNVRGDINDSVATFSQAATRENIKSGESGINAEVILSGMISGLESTGFYEMMGNLLNKDGKKDSGDAE